MTLKPTLNEQTQRENPLPVPTPEPFYSPENWPTTYRTLSRGKSGTDVYMVQCRLRELGYYHGTVTGGYYGGTIEAVRAFQQANGLKADGVCGKQTQQKLFADAQSLVADYLSFAAMSPTPLPEVTLTPEPSATPTPLPTATPEPAMFQPVEATVG
jgi:peptidoglycan hydrolase-like protein with peptidoglycan-binding domain